MGSWRADFRPRHSEPDRRAVIQPRREFERAMLVSDYVCGRLDAAGHRAVARALESDPALALHIAEAEHVRERVHSRLML